MLILKSSAHSSYFCSPDGCFFKQVGLYYHLVDIWQIYLKNIYFRSAHTVQPV